MKSTLIFPSPLLTESAGSAVKRSKPKSKWAAFFAPLDEQEPGPAPKTWVAWAWLLMMPPGVAAIWFFWLRSQ